MEMAADSGGISLRCCVCDTECVAYRKLKKHYKKKHPEYDLILCIFCKFVTVGNSDMKKHKKRNHPKERFTCNHCTFSTKSWNRWTQHEANEHLGENLPDATAGVCKEESLSDAYPGENLPDTTPGACKEESLPDPHLGESLPDTIAGTCKEESLPDPRLGESLPDTIAGTCKEESLPDPRLGESLPDTTVYAHATSSLELDSQNMSHADVALKAKTVSKSATAMNLPANRSNSTFQEFGVQGLKCPQCATSRQYTPEEPDACSHCGFGGQDSHSVPSPEGGGSAKSRFICKLCHKTFAKKINLTYHMRTHTNERPYECEFCDYLSCSNDTLQQHLRGHLGIKPYKCEVCDYSSAYRSNIVLHAVTHSTDRPFSCDFCKKKFKRKDHLSKHVKCKHAEMM
ncbi:hypothetical protein BsWGS_15779 [Bradybaena similaris]